MISSLAELQRILYEANERRIRQHVSTPRRFDRMDLDRYEQELVDSVPEKWFEASPTELRLSIRRARVVLVGDYHTLHQSQRGFMRVLAATRARNLIIGLEFVQAEHQRVVDAYLDGRVDEKTFLRRIEYEKSWPSYQVWPNFKPIFDFARNRHAKVLALDSNTRNCSSLFARDAFMAWRLAEAIRETPEAKVFVLVGEAHLAPNHLPYELEHALARLKNKAEILIIHQNLDQIWFQLVERGIEHQVDVVRLAPNRFLVPVSSPIVAQHSFLAALTDQNTHFSLESSSQLERELKKYIKILARVLGLQDISPLTDVRVCGPGDLEALYELSRRISADEWAAILAQLKQGESLCLPDQSLIYISNLSATHIAEEAAHFLKAKLASGPIPSDPVDFFYSRVLHEAVGYFGAKLFNPKLKPPKTERLREDMKEALAFGKPEFSPERAFAIKLVLWHRGHQWRKNFKRNTFNSYLKRSGFAAGLADLGPDILRPIVHLLGYELGERLYVAFKQGRIDRVFIRRIFLSKFEDPNVAFALFYDLARTLRTIKLPIRF